MRLQKCINILSVPYNVFAKTSGNHYNRHSERGKKGTGIKFYNLGIFVKLVSQKSQKILYTSEFAQSNKSLNPSLFS